MSTSTDQNKWEISDNCEDYARKRSQYDKFLTMTLKLMFFAICAAVMSAGIGAIVGLIGGFVVGTSLGVLIALFKQIGIAGIGGIALNASTSGALGGVVGGALGGVVLGCINGALTMREEQNKEG